MPLSEPEREVLELFGLEPGRQDPGFFEELFLRFGRSLPFESMASRPGEAATATTPRAPERLFSEFLEEGRGACGAERTIAFSRLASDLGYDVRLAAGELRSGRPHSAVIARLGGSEVLADVSFPLPALLPLDPPATDIPGAYGRLSLTRHQNRIGVLFDGRGQLVERLSLSLTRGPSEDEVGAEVTRKRCFLRLLDDRLLRWRAGRMEIVDAWSRLVYPLAAREKGALEALFQVVIGEGAEGPTSESTEDTEAEESAAVLTVYHGSELSLDRLRTRLRSPEDMSLLLPSGTSFEVTDRVENGWTWTLFPEGDPPRSERVSLLADGAEIECASGLPLSRRGFVLEPQENGTRLKLRATLARLVPPKGPGEAVRKTLVFHLVSELLALARPE